MGSVLLVNVQFLRVLQHSSFNLPEAGRHCIVFLWHGEYYNITKYEDGTPATDTVLFERAKHRNGATTIAIAVCSSPFPGLLWRCLLGCRKLLAQSKLPHHLGFAVL